MNGNGILKKRGGNVLAIGAHPDDLEFGAGGLLSRLVDDGAHVIMAVTAVPTLVDKRYKEAHEGAKVIGAELRILFNGKARRVEEIPMHQIVRKYDQLIEEFKPELVITHSAADLHYDHDLVHRATLSALRRTPCDLLTYISSPVMNAQIKYVGTFFADISNYIDKKIDAIKCHKSQLEKIELESIKDLARTAGIVSNKKYAEVYEPMRITI